MTTCKQYSVTLHSDADWTQASDHTKIKGIVISIELLCCKQSNNKHYINLLVENALIANRIRCCVAAILTRQRQGRYAHYHWHSDSRSM